MAEERLKYADYLQAAIGRMASNSFAAKSWSISLVSALVAYALRTNHLTLAWVGAVPVVLFWCLDAYYLALERSFRTMFEELFRAPETEKPTFDMQPKNFTAATCMDMMWRPSVALVYLPLLFVLLSVMVAGLMGYGSPPQGL